MELKLKDGGTLYYEIHGEGEPLIILNGLMMTCGSWYELVPHFSRNNQLILFDFRDQLMSSKLEHGYKADVHTDDIIQLLDHLKIDKVNMFGVSYGGQVSLDFAIKHQDRLKRLMLMSIGPKATNFLRAIGESWEEAAKLGDAEKFFTIGMPFVYAPDFYATRLDWLEERKQLFKSFLTQEWFDSFLRLSYSAKKFDYSDDIHKISVPTLMVCGDVDQLTPVAEMKGMANQMENATVLVIPDAGHGAILEKQKAFVTAINGFLASDFS